MLVQGLIPGYMAQELEAGVECIESVDNVETIFKNHTMANCVL